MSVTVPSLDERLGALLGSDPQAMADRDEILQDLCDAGPVYRFGDLTLFSRYEDVRAILHDSDRFKQGLFNQASVLEAKRSVLSSPEQMQALEELRQMHQYSLTGDGEKHERLRKLVQRCFTPRAVEDMRAGLRDYMREMLAPFSSEEVVDLAPLAIDLPLMAICDMCGVPAADRKMLRGWSDHFVEFICWLNFAPPDVPFDVCQAAETMQAFRAYVADLVESHRHSPGSGGRLVSALVDAPEGALSVDEIMGLFISLILGGHETTANLLSNGLMYLLQEPGQWDIVVAEPEIVPNAVEEMLRLTSPGGAWDPRRADVPVTLRGVDIEPGDTVFAVIIAANRDPEVFADPNRCDVRRSEAREHVAFGFGSHYCLGAGLARLEGEVYLRELSSTFPDLALSGDTIEFQGPSTIRKITKLPVVLGQRRS